MSQKKKTWGSNESRTRIRDSPRSTRCRRHLLEAIKVLGQNLLILNPALRWFGRLLSIGVMSVAVGVR